MPISDHTKYQTLWVVTAFLVMAAFGAGIITMAALDNRPLVVRPAARVQPIAVAPTQTGTVVNSSVADFAIKLDHSSIPSGKVTFHVSNAGPSLHEFVIMKTKHPAGTLPMIRQEGYKRAAEDAKGDVHVAELGNIPVGGSKDLSITLKSGHYVIVCNLPQHYRLGMHVDLTVTPRNQVPPSTPSGNVGTVIKSSVADFSIKLDRSTVPAGKMTFQVANVGPSFHEFVILKTDHPADSLPIIQQEGYRRAAEDANGDTNVAELGGIKVGGSKDLTTTLKPGHYVIVCNLPMHYKLGMRTAFTVK